MTTQVYPRTRQPSETAIEAELLLARYPDLSERELTRLIGIYPYLAMLDVGLMTADNELSEKLSAFKRDHADKLKTPVRVLVVAFLGPALVAVLLLWSVWNQSGGL